MTEIQNFSCTDFRRLASEITLLRETTLPPQLASHARTCSSCNAWSREQQQFDHLIRNWSDTTPSISPEAARGLETQVLSIRKQAAESRLPMPQIRTRIGSNRRLAAFVATIAGILLLVLPSLSLHTDTDPRYVRLATAIDREYSSIASIVDSVHDLVVDASGGSSPSATLSDSTRENPSPKAETVQTQATTAPNVLSSNWSELQRDLEPIRAEVGQAFGFLWSVLPEDES